MTTRRHSQTPAETADPALEVTPDLSHYIKPPVERIVCVRYFLTITPPSEGSLVKWVNPPEAFSGAELKQALESKGLSFANHRPQLYDAKLRRFLGLGEGVVLRVPAERKWLFLNLRLVPRIPVVAPANALEEAGAEEEGQPMAAAARAEREEKKHAHENPLLHVAMRARRMLLNRRAFSMDDLTSVEEEVVLEFDPRTPLMGQVAQGVAADRSCKGGRKQC